jgi:hypothetical protein
MAPLARKKLSGRTASGTNRFTKLYPTTTAPHNRVAEIFRGFGDFFGARFARL